jgi:hypothetical protein
MPQYYFLLPIFVDIGIQWSRDRVVGIATRYGLDDRGVRVRVPVASRIISCQKSFRPALWSTQLSIQWVARALSPGVKRPGREADHSPEASAEVKKIWICTSTSYMPSWRSA